LDDVVFKLNLRVEDLVLLYTIARGEGISVHELILKAVRQYVSGKVQSPTVPTTTTASTAEEGGKR